MYILHFGVLQPPPQVGVRFDDEALGKLVVVDKMQHEEMLALQTSGGSSYTATVEMDTFRLWGKRGDTHRLGTHVTVQLNHWPTVREVNQIREALRKLTLTGRPCDWVVLTNAEKWSETVRIYLFESTESGLPSMVLPERQP